MNIRASYAQEVEAPASHFTRERGAKRFGLLFQGDAFGQTIKGALERALKEGPAKLIAAASYQRGWTATCVRRRRRWPRPRRK